MKLRDATLHSATDPKSSTAAGQQAFIGVAGSADEPWISYSSMEIYFNKNRDFTTTEQIAAELIEPKGLVLEQLLHLGLGGPEAARDHFVYVAHKLCNSQVATAIRKPHEQEIIGIKINNTRGLKEVIGEISHDLSLSAVQGAYLSAFVEKALEVEAPMKTIFMLHGLAQAESGRGPSATRKAEILRDAQFFLECLEETLPDNLPDVVASSACLLA